MQTDLLSHVEALTVSEADRKAQLEATIERDMQTFVEVGLALMEIRDRRLYRAEFGTFEEYCQVRWGWGRNYTNKLIASADVVKNLGTIVPILPATESQARPLAALPPAQQREAWERVLETAPNGKITAAIVTQAAKEIRQERTDQRRQERIKKIVQVAQNSGNNEWYTPAPYIEAARAVMGSIDLDPASTEIANGVVRATLFYSADDNGLLYDWQGNIWMNPPYAQPLITQFSTKLQEEWNAGRVKQAIVLVNNATETAWFQSLVRCASAVCFPLARIRFWSPDKATAAPLQGQAILYLGQNIDGFVYQFGSFGWCAEVR